MVMKISPNTFLIVSEIVGDLLKITNQWVFESFSFALKIANVITNLTLREENVVKLLQSNETFDVVVLEGFASESLFGIANHFNASVVILTTTIAPFYISEKMGAPVPLSHVPHIYLPYTDHMNFLERSHNLLLSFLEKFYYYYTYFPQQEELYNNIFPDPKPPLKELHKNVSLVLANNHFAITYPRPFGVNMVEIAGLHIQTNNQTLPTHIQAFLDGASDGAIYFSLGSNAKSTNLPRNILDALLKVFRSLKQRVLWKWEDDTLPGKSENIMISSWFPQSAILSHPNMKLLISHGGYLSVMEAVYHAVPIIGLPIMGDQPAITARSEKAGYGLYLSWEDLSEKSLRAAIHEALSNTKYAENVKQASIRFRDQPITPLNQAIFWVEYVARHKGAPHMRSAAQHLSIIEYHNLDVYTLFFLTMVIFVYILKCLICRTVKAHHSKFSKKIDSKVKFQ